MFQRTQIYFIAEVNDIYDYVSIMNGREKKSCVLSASINVSWTTLITENYIINII